MKRCAMACGECGRCRRLEAAVNRSRRLQRELAQALVLLQACAWDLQMELNANSAEDVRAHPALRTKVGLVARIERLTRQVAST